MYKQLGANLTKSTFRAEFEKDDGTSVRLTLYPPKINTIRKFTRLTDDDLDGTIECIAEIISANRENRKFSADDAGEIFDFEDAVNFVTDFSAWIENLKKK